MTGLARITTPFRGREATIREVADELGISYQAAWRHVTVFGETGDDIESSTRRARRKSKLHKHGGKALTVTEWAKKLGVTEHCIRMRLKKHGTPVGAGRMGHAPRLLFDGKSVAELAEEHGIKRDTIYSRLKSGETIEEALGPYRPNTHKLLNGVPMSETMKQNGVSRQLAEYRIKRGWPAEDAISTPPRKWIRKD